MGAAALPLLAVSAADATEIPAAAALTVPDGLAAPNLRAARIAAASPLIRTYYARVRALASSIGDAALRGNVTELLERPTPRYMQNYTTDDAREALRDELARDGFLAAATPIAAIFPPVGTGGIAQPFWSAPGSETNGHHDYPGGLCAHELFNASIAAGYTEMYDRQYFDARREVDRDLCVAAALYHDIMKTVVFQYNEDGTFFDEVSLGATGAHHCLSGAEAIARGHDARFVVVLLSAHAAPSLGDEAKVVTWCRIAARIAGVDPVEFGMLAKTTDGFALAHRAPIEAFVNHLSDHDYVLAIPAAQAVRTQLAVLAPKLGIANDTAALNWWRLRVTSSASAIALYRALEDGDRAFEDAVRQIVA